MSAITGYYFDGRSALRRQAELTLQRSQAVLHDGEQTLTYSHSDLLVSPRTGSHSRFIALADGGQFQCADSAQLDQLPQQSASDGVVAWLERRWTVALACVVLTAMVLFVGYRYGLPAAAQRLALRIPIQSEQALGTDVLASMHEYGWLSPSQLEPEQQARIAGQFDNFRRGMAYESQLRLEFRSSDVIGANAFALPGGTIVITDDLIELAQSDDEVLAIIAHEIGHIERRHIVRGLIQNSLVAVMVTAVTADAATLTAAVAGLPVLLVQTEYSREFETEADQFAFALLRDQGLSPAAFADIMERLQELYPDPTAEQLNFLSSHPLMEGRIAQARDAALGGQSNEPGDL